jgi:vacuolar-type H+-ATPase subunit I/STV1
VKQLEKENQYLQKEVKRLNEELEKERNINLKLNQKLNNYTKKIEEKEKTLKKLNKELEELKTKSNLSPGEKIFPIIFISVDQKLHYSIMCKNTDPFYKIERYLYDENPEYDDSNNYFLFKGRTIDKNKTIEGNGIKYSDIITLNKCDSSLNSSKMSFSLVSQ